MGKSHLKESEKKRLKREIFLLEKESKLLTAKKQKCLDVDKFRELDLEHSRITIRLEGKKRRLCKTY